METQKAVWEAFRIPNPFWIYVYEIGLLFKFVWGIQTQSLSRPRLHTIIQFMKEEYGREYCRVFCNIQISFDGCTRDAFGRDSFRNRSGKEHSLWRLRRPMHRRRFLLARLSMVISDFFCPNAQTIIPRIIFHAWATNWLMTWIGVMILDQRKERPRKLQSLQRHYSSLNKQFNEEGTRYTWAHQNMLMSDLEICENLVKIRWVNCDFG